MLENLPRMTPPEPPCLEAGPPEASPGGKVLLARTSTPGLFGTYRHLLLWHLLLLPGLFGTDRHLLLWCFLAFASSRRALVGMLFRVGLCRSHCTPETCEDRQGNTAKKDPSIAMAPAASVVPAP